MSAPTVALTGVISSAVPFFAGQTGQEQPTPRLQRVMEIASDALPRLSSTEQEHGVIFPGLLCNVQTITVVDVDLLLFLSSRLSLSYVVAWLCNLMADSLYRITSMVPAAQLGAPARMSVLSALSPKNMAFGRMRTQRLTTWKQETSYAS